DSISTLVILYLYLTICRSPMLSFFSFTAPSPSQLYSLSLHDALPISSFIGLGVGLIFAILLVYFVMVVNFQSWLDPFIILMALRSEEHTSELQSRFDLVCRLLLEKKKKK